MLDARWALASSSGAWRSWAAPEALARRKARELAEHRADLREAALEDGLSEAEAEA